MKKYIFTICLIFVIIIIVLFMKLQDVKKSEIEIKKYNNTYEQYNTENLNGLDITTIINKAIDNNEKYEIKKDKDGIYISDEAYSIKIYIKMMINEKTYSMEKLNAVGMESFVQHFGIINFKCIDIGYHEKTGRVSQMTFEATEY